jgi:dihydropteroate synthase
VDHVPKETAGRLAQAFLAVGGDAAMGAPHAEGPPAETTMLLAASAGQYRRMLEEVTRLPGEVGEVGRAVQAALAHRAARPARLLRGAHRPIPLGEHTRVMGVVNVTPDSFSDGGQHMDPERAVAWALKLAREGADLLDIGAESTRPGASEVSVEEEWRRLEPVLTSLHTKTPVPLSVDTRHAEVARRALEAGADLVNDVSGLRDPEMRRLIARTGAPAVVAHMRGVPETMQRDTRYADVTGEVYAALAQAVALAVEEGVSAEGLLIDPGLGFGKSAEQNLELLARLSEFRSLGYPVLIGASRKSFLSRALGGVPPSERLEAGLAAAVIAARAGASYVRTHDVGPTVRALRLADAVERAGFEPEPSEPRSPG